MCCLVFLWIVPKTCVVSHECDTTQVCHGTPIGGLPVDFATSNYNSYGVKNAEFKLRLEKIINEKFGGNISRFSRASGVPVSTIRSYVRQEKIATPGMDMLKKLAVAAGVGVQDIYPIPDFEKVGSEGLVDHGDHTVPVLAHDKCISVGVFDLFQAHLDAPVSLGVFCVSAVLYSPTMIVLRARGGSMSPTISDGALVGVDKSDRQIVSGDMYVVRRPYEGAVIRRVYVSGDEIVLSPESREHQVLTLKDVSPSNVDFIIGKVKWVIQRL